MLMQRQLSTMLQLRLQNVAAVAVVNDATVTVNSVAEVAVVK